MKIIIVPILLMITASTAWGGTEDSIRRDNLGAARTFNAIDQNNDGVISKQEAAGKGNLDANFSEYDKNNDGALEFDGRQ